MRVVRRGGRLWAATVLLALCPLGLVLVVPAAAAPTGTAGPVPRAACGPGSDPETGMQGRIPPAEVESGRAARGYYCNTEQIGHVPGRAGWKIARYGDCAYYNAEPAGLPLFVATGAVPGTHVLDVSDPAAPVQTDFLRTPAMQSPHESMSIDKRRGLLAAVLGNLATAPGVLEIYDIKSDCRHPRLISSLPSALLGHEGNFSEDGLTFYTGSLPGGTLTAVDVSNPAAPTLIAVERVKSHGMSTNTDGTRLYDTVTDDPLAGLLIYDTTEIQSRKPNAAFKLLSRVTWPSKSTPQYATSVTIGGKPYLIETDEFGRGDKIGAARIIDISDELAPRVISDIRLDVHMPQNQEELAGDTVPFLGAAYTGHYCSVPSRDEPGIVACSMLRSGVRVFDIRDPHRPKEIAYYSPPAVHDTVDSGGTASGFHTGANVEFVPERGEMWLTDQETGFHVVRFTNGAWPFRPQPAAAPSAPAPAAAPAAGPAHAGNGRPAAELPATGLAASGAAAALLLLAALGASSRLRARNGTL